MKIVGHRGAKGLAPENTRAGLQRAIDCGVDEIEIDARVTRDGVVVVHHDAAIETNNGEEYTIAAHSYDDLVILDPDLLRLADAIKYVDRQVPLHIEVKPGEPLEPIVKLLQAALQAGWQPTDFLLASRDFKLLTALHSRLPDITTVVIEYWSGVRASHRATALGTTRISMLEYWLWTGFIKGMAKKYQLYSFPGGTPGKERFFARLGLGGRSNDPQRIIAWQKAGLAGVITDYPDRMRSTSKQH